MKRVEVSLAEPAPMDGAVLLFPRPFGHWDQIFEDMDLSSLESATEVTALNSDQRAYLGQPSNGTAPAITYTFETGDTDVPASIWDVQNNHLTVPDEELADLAQDLAKDARSEAETISLLMDYVAGVFGYDHPDQHFYEGLEKVPAVCGTTKGSCVDINTFLLAAARSLSIRGQYIAGYWFHPDKVETLDMHCWLAFEPDGKLTFWDLAHHLKWGVETLGPGLNPAGGRRVAMSCGRGLQFETSYGQVEISHFSEPVWILPSGETVEPELRAKIFE